MRQKFSREQKTTIVNAILAVVLTVVVLQLWLLTATMNSFLGGEGAVVLPALAGSVACLALNAGLLAWIYRMERP
jgi:uncharacterized membrane-anchored protein